MTSSWMLVAGFMFAAMALLGKIGGAAFLAVPPGLFRPLGDMQVELPAKKATKRLENLGLVVNDEQRRLIGFGHGDDSPASARDGDSILGTQVAAASEGGRRWSHTRKVLPRPTSLSTSIRPPCSAMIP